jgi:MerR family transcriptional regulator/heat shock protein HspR
MSNPLIPREEVAERLAVSSRVLIRYESRGLIHATREANVEGYSPAEIRRLWTIVTLQRDLGINLAGVEAVLKLRSHMLELHDRMTLLAEELHQALEVEDDDQTSD